MSKSCHLLHKNHAAAATQTHAAQITPIAAMTGAGKHASAPDCFLQLASMFGLCASPLLCAAAAAKAA
jgi:hypothetical protein